MIGTRCSGVEPPGIPTARDDGTVAIWLLDGLQVLQTGSLGTVPSNWLIATTGDYLKA